MSSKITIEKWEHHIQFILSVVGYAVGLGNIWRFPYLAYENGGGAFLIPYVIFLLLAGIPLFHMEFGISQFSSAHPLDAFAMVPIFKGIGYAMGVMSGFVTLYYNMIISWAFIYLYESFTSQLPWASCGNSWNTDNCTDRTINLEYNISFLNISSLSKINKNYLCDNQTITNFLTSKKLFSNTTLDILWKHYNCSEYRGISPSEEFWKNKVLQQTESIAVTGRFIPSLVGALAVSWVIVCLCLSKGIKSSGKVVYVTAILPYILITVILIGASIQPGASKGIYYFIHPTWSKLKEGSTWISAATQIFYSLGVGFGSLLLYSSYNDFNNKFTRDAVLCALINCVTSIYAGFAVFAIIGYLSYKTGLPVKNVVTDGAGLIFVAYPEVLATLPVPPLWSCLLFLMIISVGLDSQFAMFETFLSVVFDSVSLLKKWRITTTIVCSALWFILGLTFTTQAGVYWVTLMDKKSAGLSLVIIALCEVIAVCWIYGIRQFSQDMAMMSGTKPNYYWQFTWLVTSPLILMAIFLFAVFTYTPFSYNGVKMPAFSEVLGWGIFLAVVIWIPVYAIYFVYVKVIKQGQSFSSLFKPSSRHGPILDVNRDGIRYKYQSSEL